jgi:probable rRNA maturation factor
MPAWEIDIDSDGSPPDPRLIACIDTAMRIVLAAQGAEDAHISVALLTDEGIRTIHRDFLGDDTPTDVITFPLREPGRPLVGDVYIGIEQARAQAAEHGVSVDEEIMRLAIHAALHLLGWDHPEDGDRSTSPMYVRQEELLRRAVDALGSGIRGEGPT